MYLTLFYTKREIALRIGYLFVSAALAGASGGLLAYGVGFMDGVAGQRGWRWILILEGLPTIVLGIATWFLLADDPESAHYLSKVSDFCALSSFPQFSKQCSFQRRVGSHALVSFAIKIFREPTERCVPGCWLVLE